MGRTRRIIQGKLNVTVDYDQASRPSETCVKEVDSDLSLTTRLKYDDFDREIERTVIREGQKTLYRLCLTYDQIGLVKTRDLIDDGDKVLRHECFQYDSLKRLLHYQCQGNSQELPTDEHGNQVQSQEFTFNDYNSLVQALTVFQDKTQNLMTYIYSDKDPAQLIQIKNTHTGFPTVIDLTYDDNGCLTQDEQGRTLEYNTTNRLSTVRDANKEILSQYRYDAAGRLVCQIVPGQPDRHLFYRGDILIAVTIGDSQVSYLSDGSAYWGQTTLTTSPNY